MVGKSPITADGEQRAALRALAHSRDRLPRRIRAAGDVADAFGLDQPAHSAEAFGVREDTVRLWRCDFADGGVEALKASVAPWPSPCEERGRAARRHASFGSSRRQPAQLDDRAPDQRDRGARGRPDRLGSQLSKTLRKKTSRWRRPRHSLKVARSPARSRAWACAFQLRKAQAEAGDIVLLYGDESEALTRTLIWRGRGPSAAPVCAMPRRPGQAKKVAMIGSLDHLTLPVDRAHQPDQAQQRLHRSPGATRPSLSPPTRTSRRPGVVLVEDNGPDPCQQARPCRPRSAQANSGSPSSSCQNTRPNSTTSRLSGTISKRTISPTTPSPTPPTSIEPSIKLSKP